MRLKRAARVVGLVALALVVSIMVALQIPAVQDRVLGGMVDRILADRPDGLFDDDAMRVLFCGTASPLPHATRAKACVAVFAGGSFYVVDVGPGSWNNLGLWRVDAARLGGVFLTHFHSDHIGDLGEFDLQSWVQGRPGPLAVFGPDGVERVVAGFEEAYALDAVYRTAHHGAELVDPDTGRMVARTLSAPANGDATALAFEANGLRVGAFAVEHHPVEPAFGYRFDYRGRSVVITGDTIKSERVIAAARGADVLVHEAQAQHLVARMREAAGKADRPRIEKVLGDIPDYHTSPVEAAEVANEAGVGHLVLYHLTPPPPARLVERVFVRGVDDVRGDDWTLADDGLLVTLPADSDAIEFSRLH